MEVTELLKRSLAFGLGAASFSLERVKQFSEDMVRRGEMSTEEAGHFMDEVSERAREDKETIRQWVSEQVSKMIRQAGMAQSEDVASLEARIAVLERRVAELGADVVMPPASHTTGTSEESS